MRRPSPPKDLVVTPTTRTAQSPRAAAPLKARELVVLEAVAHLPQESMTPAAAMAALIRQGLPLSPSTIAQILQRLERRGLIRMGRKQAGRAATDSSPKRG